jgi:hypothetical protein
VTFDKDVYAPITSSGKSYNQFEGPRTIDLQIENVMLGRTNFEVGEQVFLSAIVSRNAFLACYLSNATGGVIRLVPNPVSSRGQVSANQAVRLPDWMSPNPGFVIETASSGTEGILCVATDDDVTAKLPEKLRVPALTPMRDIVGLKDVAKGYADVLPADTFTQTSMQWVVSPKRVLQAPKTSSGG